MTNDEMLTLLSGTITPHRFSHTMGVLRMAEKLSVIHGIDLQKARVAAILHDCAKSMSMDQMLSVMAKEGIVSDEYELATEAIMHAPAGCAIAKSMYGVLDKDILDAIRYHTIGCPQPNVLTKLIFVADFIEEGRKPFPGLEEARELALIDLDKALIKCARLSNDYVLSCGGKIHPNTLEMINNTEVHI